MELGCITEQGDMGLGFSPISESEFQEVKDNLKKEFEEAKSSENEDIDH